MLHNGPLSGRCILRLVHQQMVDAAVQPEQNPSGHGLVCQKVACLADQVVEIQHAHRCFARCIILHENMSEIMQRCAAVKGHQRLAILAQGGDRFHQPGKRIRQIRMRRPHALCWKAFGLGAKGVLGLFAKQKHVF